MIMRKHRTSWASCCPSDPGSMVSKRSGHTGSIVGFWSWALVIIRDLITLRYVYQQRRPHPTMTKAQMVLRRAPPLESFSPTLWFGCKQPYRVPG